MTKHLPVYTNSSLSCFRRCPREYYFRYVKLRRPKEIAKPLVVGKYMHRDLNALWSRQLQLIDVNFSDQLSKLDHAKHMELMIGYEEHWKDGGFKTVAVEKRFKVQCGPYELAGSIDALAEKNDRLLIVEHKTSSSDIANTSSYWDRITTLDSQLSTYWIAAKELGYDVDEVLYDVIHVPKSEPLKATPVDSRKYTKKGNLYAGQRDKDETLEEYQLKLREDIKTNPEWYYNRRKMVRLEDELYKSHTDNDVTHEFIQWSTAYDLWARNTGSCYQFGRKCDYYNVCSGTDSIESNNFRTADVQHEELV